MLLTEISQQGPFRVVAHINIPSYDDSINTKVLDLWIDKPNTYFDIYIIITIIRIE